MRRARALPAALALVLAPVVLPAPAPAADATGGIPAGSAPRARIGMPAGRFSARPATLAPGGSLTLAYRVAGRSRAVRVRIDIVRTGERVPVRRLRLGFKRAGRRYATVWTPAPAELAAGTYAARLVATDRAAGGVDAAGRPRAASVTAVLTVVAQPAAAPKTAGAGLFPVAGPWSLGGEEGRFGADRGGRAHEGQDILAAAGTPVVAPRAGVVVHRAYQARGAGHYVVLRADDRRDLVFMHLRAPSPAAVGATVAAAQPLGEVGTTGRTTGPHLHFEIWPDGWRHAGSRPIDPRPDLDAWALATPRAATPQPLP